MARRRKDDTADLPKNLYARQSGGHLYYSFRNIKTKAEVGLGRDRDEAILAANELNELLKGDRQVIVSKKLGTLLGKLDRRGLLEAETILASMIPFKQICGIYFLIAGGVIVYVGQSNDCMTRISRHTVEQQKLFDGFFIVEAVAEHLDELEGLYIAKFAPKMNKRGRRIDGIGSAWGKQIF